MSPVTPRRETALLLFMVLPVYVWGLDHWPMWDAESWTLRVSALPLQGLYDEVARDRHPPLFFFLEALLVRLSPTVAMLRVPAALSALLAIAVVHHTAVTHLGRRAGWFAGLCLALSPFHTAYAANARSGTLTTLLGATALASALSLVHGPRPRQAALGLALSLGLGLWVHYDMGLAVAGAGLGGLLGLALSPGEGPSRRERALLGAAALSVAALSFLPWVLGPMVSQSLQERPAERSVEVWHFLWWSVGPDYRPMGGTLLVLLGLLGLLRAARQRAVGGLLGGWLAAGLLVTYLWSSNRDTLGKTYLYAPLQPLFVLLVGNGLAGLCGGVGRLWGRSGAAAVGRSERVAAVALSLGLFALSARPLLDVLLPTSNLVSVAPLTPGVYDPRLDALTLASAPVGHAPRVMPDARAAMDWVAARPALSAFQSGPPQPAWRALTRTDERSELQRYTTEAGLGCLFTEAFSALLVVPFPEDCVVLRRVVREVGEARRYGPYLLEASLSAAAAGDREAALRLAEQAIETSVVSVRPDRHLTLLLLEGGEPEAAVRAAAEGIRTASRYRLRNDWIQLLELQAEAARAAGDTATAARTRQELDCLRARLTRPTEAWCAAGLLGFL
jgi:hypothetical protein